MITIQTIVKAPIEKVWQYWTDPKHVTKWNFASDDWESPSTENDLRAGGKFKTRMQSKDGKHGFDFEGTYDEVNTHELIKYTMDDGRQVITNFAETPEGIQITESFDPEKENPEEMQRAGWQSILENFKKYVENN